MYTITKEKQFIYLTDDENNSKYIIDLQNQNIKNSRRQNTTLKNFPKSILDKGINTEVKNIDETSKYYSNFFYNFCQSDVRNIDILFKSLLITEKILSYYSFMNVFPTFSEELFFLKSNLKIFEENFSIIAQIIKNENYPLWIGNDVWIGEGAFLTGGITVGDGAMILAHAVVVQDVPPYAIVGGVPAKVISFRYDEETINWLLDIQWWNLDTNWLKENWKLLCDIDKMKAYFKDYPIDV